MAKTTFRPEILMCVVWIAFVTVYATVPIRYVHTPGFAAWGLMLAGVVAFCLGAALSRLSTQGPAQPAEDDFGYLDALIIICAIMGLTGAAFIVIDKVFFSGQDWSIGITALRDRRFVEVVEGVPIRRSPLVYIGYLTISFSCVSVCLFLLKGEKVGRLAGWLAQASILAMAVYAVLYGGRMPILLIILLAIGCAMVRKLTHQTLLPSGWYLWPKTAFVTLAFFAYTNLVWTLRRDMNRVVDFDGFVRVADKKWDLAISPWLDHAVRSGKIAAGTVMDFVSTAMYLTHSPTTVQRIVEHSSSLSTYFGLYQIGVLSPLFDVFAPGLKLPETMRAELASTGIFGWFPNAWGAWLLDCGYYFGLFAIIVWGVLSGAAYRAVLRGGSVAAQLMLVFVYMTILVSPLNAPFGMANSFLIFCSFAVVAAWLCWRTRRAQRSIR
ncbi:hypothetical protein J6500_07910 [Bradyrhizobium sp. WSM 1704]|uniref:hypothetical protein n=1 Tax=Bradyrhizobium semiaridum TaxID=2821404 RepID=UPI001CE34077|nr:hypothetical protein [Bradyrhizobium semiaridum]MCA6121824.1 hypothetical protein [Bradyrhizobium semiaridum]